MPYIDEDIRAMYRPDAPIAPDVGTLTYQVTCLVDQFLHVGPEPEDAPRYADYAEAIAALECAKLELYRRLVAPYEDTKVAANGDVYHPTERWSPGPIRAEMDATEAEYGLK